MALSLSTRSLPCVTGSAVCAVQCGVEKTTRDPSLKSTYCGKQQKGRQRERRRHRERERKSTRHTQKDRETEITCSKKTKTFDRSPQNNDGAPTVSAERATAAAGGEARRGAQARTSVTRVPLRLHRKANSKATEEAEERNNDNFHQRK